MDEGLRAPRYYPASPRASGCSPPYDVHAGSPGCGLFRKRHRQLEPLLMPKPDRSMYTLPEVRTNQCAAGWGQKELILSLYRTASVSEASDSPRVYAMRCITTLPCSAPVGAADTRSIIKRLTAPARDTRASGAHTDSGSQSTCENAREGPIHNQVCCAEFLARRRFGCASPACTLQTCRN